MGPDPNDVNAQLTPDAAASTPNQAAQPVASGATQQQPSTTATSAAAAKAPKMSMKPLFVNFVQNMIKPHMQAGPDGSTPRPVSRTSVMEDFIGNIIYAMGQGFAQQGHGPGSFGRGFGAAMTAPYQRDVQQFGMQQQADANQAEIAQRQAQTELTQAQLRGLPAEQAARLASMTAQPRFDPTTKQYLGTMTDGQYTQYVKGQGAAAQSAQARITSEQLKVMSLTGQIGFVKPAMDDQGNATFAAYDKQGNFVKFLDKSIDPSLLQKTTTTGQWLPDGSGGFMFAPKTTTSGPNIPGQAQSAAAQPGATPPSGWPRPTGAGPTAATRPTAGASGPRTILGNSPVFAYDPVKNERVLTTPKEAAANGWQQPIPAKETDVEKYRSAQVQFNDVQSNVSRYRAAANRFSREGSPADIVGINTVINEAKLGGGIHLGPAGIEIPGYSSIAEAADRVARSAAYKGLSTAGKDLVDGFLRTMAAVPAYQKALSNIGRSNKEMLDLELANIPNPTMAPNDILRKLQAFQENIDQGSAGIPRMAGIPTIKDIRAKFEQQQQQLQQIRLPQPFPTLR